MVRGSFKGMIGWPSVLSASDDNDWMHVTILPHLAATLCPNQSWNDSRLLLFPVLLHLYLVILAVLLRHCCV